jgi:hypothetical protein
VFFAEAMNSRPARSASDWKFISWEMGTKRHESTARSGETPTVEEMYVFIERGSEGAVERVRWIQG